jgi:hypothetical protein
VKSHLEELGLLDPFQEVVATTLLLHNVAGLVRLPSVSNLFNL